ncbi:MAG: choice-of-anchor J domain-containing protein, partial [Bacteroidota bacterium]|nr:choice-of-anchor J domain-containing protein [Bacteroidota bacterium]
MRKKFTLLMSFLLVAFFTFGQEWHAVEKVKKEKEEKTKVERGINPYRNAVDGIKVHHKASENKPSYDYSISDSPGQFAYDSNTLTELGWETFSVSATDEILEMQINYTWNTDTYTSEGSFHIKSPLGTSAVIASGDEDGTYSVTLTAFNGEPMNGDWDIWIEDSYGDGGHQATEITVSFTIQDKNNDAGISEIVSLNEDEITYEGEKDLVVQLTNYGIEDLTSVTIGWGYVLGEDSVWGTPVDWTGTLASAGTEEVNLGSISLEGGNTYLIGAWTELPNGVTDEFTANDTTGIEIDVYKKGALIESFEGSAFPPKNWVVVNNDEGVQTWMHDNSYSFNGDYSASVRWENSTITNDDWLITPKLLVEEGDELSFWARSTSSYFEDDFRVYVSKTGNELDDFTIMLDEVMNAPYDWTQFTYNLTENANIAAGDEIYVAIQYFSLDQLRLAVDMFTGPMLADLENNDVAVNEITTSMLQPGEENMLEAVVQNVGLNDQTSIEVTFKVNGTEVGSTTIASLTYQETATASLNWTTPGEPGKYIVEAFVADDDNNENNTATNEVWALAEQIAYVNDYMAGQFQSITLPYPQETEVISATSVNNYAGTWALGKWYAVSENNALVTVNTETGIITTIGTLDLNSVTGIAYDWNSNTMYAMDYNGENSELYTVDIQTAEVTRVGLGSTPGININLACDLEGNLYSMNISDDKLYAISKTAGAGTPVGDLGIDISYAQDMEFDHANGDILYATAYAASDGGLYVIDPQTGEASLLGNFTAGNELGGFAIPYFTPEPQVAEVYPLNNSEDNAIDEDLYVVFDQAVDSVDFSGITVTGANTGEVTNVMATLTDSIITITHDALENDDQFTVMIPAGAVTAEEPNEEITWSFGTIMAPPQLELTTPAHGALGVALDADLSIVFDQEIFDNNLASSVFLDGNIQGSVTGVNASINPDGKTVVITHDDFTTYEDTITLRLMDGAVVNADGVESQNEIQVVFYLMKEGQP